MILTCPQCKAQYKLDPAMLGTVGRDVRCVTCSHTWFQLPEDTGALRPEKLKETAEPAQSVTEALHNILEKDDAAFEAVLSTVVQGAKPAKQGQEKKAPEAPVEAVPPSPAAVPEPRRRSVIKQEAVVVTHNPFGLSADVFGASVFLLCCFVTLAVLLAGKTPIVREWPQMALLYRTMGISVKAPGEGLRLSEITAERRIDDNGKVLVLEGKMTNMTERDIAYPTLHVTLKNSSNGATKIWDVRPGVTQIASGDVVPLMLQLNDPPEDGSTIEVRVKEEK